MKYLKNFNESNSEELSRQLTDQEAKYYLERNREEISENEFLRLKEIQFKYYRDLPVYDIVYKKGSTRYTFNNLDNKFKVNIPITIDKIEDDWWIVTYVYNRGAFPDDTFWLCDTIDGVEVWFEDNI